jgi:hypothetical protein
MSVPVGQRALLAGRVFEVLCTVAHEAAVPKAADVTSCFEPTPLGLEPYGQTGFASKTYRRPTAY